MRKIVFFVSILLLSTVHLSAKGTTFSGRLTGTESNKSSAYISKIAGSSVIPFDTVDLDTKGNFKFNAEIDEPTLFLISFDGYRKSVIHLMLEPNDKVSTDMRINHGIIEVVDAKGSDNVVLYKDFNQILFRYALRVDSLNTEYALPSTNEERKQQLSTEFQTLQISQNVELRQLLTKNSDVLMSAFLVTYFDSDIETYIDLFESIEKNLTPKYGGNQFVQYVSSRVKTSLTAGRMASEITMSDPDGKIRKLSDLRGKVVMIDFWASWCRPCRMENPNVVKLYQKYHDKGFEIYSVSLDKKRDDWLRAIDQDNLIWPNHVSDLNGWTSSGGAAYGITSIPSTVLVDREGRIIARNLRGIELANKLREIFGE